MGFTIPYLNFSALLLNEIGDGDYRNRVNALIAIGWAVFEIIGVIIGYAIES